MRGWFQSASCHQQRHHGSPLIVSLVHVWSDYQLVHPANLVSCSAHSPVGDPYRAEFTPTLPLFWVSCGHIVEISPCGVWVRCIIPPFLGVPAKAHNFVNWTDFTVLTRSKHPHGLVTVNLNASIGFIGHNNVKDPWACDSVIHSHQSFICVTVWIQRSVFEWRFKHRTPANVWFSFSPGHLTLDIPIGVGWYGGRFCAKHQCINIIGRHCLSKSHSISSKGHHIIYIPYHANAICLGEIMAMYHLLGQLLWTKKTECKPLLVHFEGDITFSLIRDKCTIGCPNFYTAWEQFCSVFRVQAVVVVIWYDASASTRIP